MVDDVEVAVIIRTDNPFSFVVKAMTEGNSILMLNVIMAMVMFVSYVHRTVAFFAHV